MAGFPLAGLDDKGLHAFAEGFSLKKLMLTKEEASLLSFMFEISKTLGRDFEESFGQLLKKVLTPEAEPMFYAKIPEGIKMDKQYLFMDDLKKAVRLHNKIEVHYVTEEKESTFVAHPFKIIFFDGFWYLLVRTDEDERIKRLRLECIRNIKVLSSHFKVPANLKTMLDESVNIWFSDQRNKKVILKVEKEAARFFKTKKYLPLQKITKYNKDGSLTIEAKVAQDMEVLPTILLWIPYVRVIAPKKLALDIKDIVKGYLQIL